MGPDTETGRDASDKTTKYTVNSAGCSQVLDAVLKNYLKELERLSKQQIMVPLWLDKSAEWYKNLVIVPKPNGSVIVIGPSKATRH